jgi:Tol biopolymer transport system component
MLPKWIAVVGSVVAMLLTGLASPAQAAFPGKNGRIAFSSDRESPFAACSLCRSIYTMNPDGTGVVRLTNGPATNINDQEPSWSPDGKRIAFAGRDVSGCGCGSFLYVMNADGSGLTQIPNTGFNAYGPSWSPDGKRIAFTNIAGRREQGCAPLTDIECENRGLYDIFTIGVDGSGLTQLTSGNNADVDPAWSPDGAEIAFISSRFLPDHLSSEFALLWKMNADGTGQTNLTRNASDERDPDWSPDGRRIVFHSDRQPHYGGSKIWEIDRDGSHLVQLTGEPSPTGYIDRWPAWSPDGARIAFTSTRSDEGWRIWSMNAAGTDRTQITTRVGAGNYDFDADWQPIPPPRREDYQNASQFCKAERDFLGEAAFRQKYGGGADAHGRCVSRNT